VPVEALAPSLIAGQAEPDAGLREYLRAWRRAAAQEQRVPAYVVLLDTSLEDLCRKQPATLEELRGVFGFGEIKTARYGPGILAALAAYRRGARVGEPGGRGGNPGR